MLVTRKPRRQGGSRTSNVSKDKVDNNIEKTDGGAFSCLRDKDICNEYSMGTGEETTGHVFTLGSPRDRRDH